jgi:two-component system, OmpR family, KDP operon response regulator KdpE
MSAATDARPHVLVVEDDANAAGALRVLFEETGHRVTVVHSVSGAVGAAEADTPDLVLLDLTLPDGDGLDVLARLRARGARVGTVVALTGHEGAQIIAECHAAGCTEVLTKPVPIREILKRLPGWLGKS